MTFKNFSIASSSNKYNLALPFDTTITKLQWHHFQAFYSFQQDLENRFIQIVNNAKLTENLFNLFMNLSKFTVLLTIIMDNKINEIFIDLD